MDIFCFLVACGEGANTHTTTPKMGDGEARMCAESSVPARRSRCNEVLHPTLNVYYCVDCKRVANGGDIKIEEYAARAAARDARRKEEEAAAKVHVNGTTGRNGHRRNGHVNAVPTTVEPVGVADPLASLFR